MRFLIALIISIKGIGLSEHIITNHVQSDPDQLLCRKGYNFLLLLSGIANSGLVGRKEEKQKVKSMYGMLEDQFRLTFERADRQKGVTGENLLVLLERRLDNTIFRIGMASSRNQARQMVRHKHVLVNGKKVNIPSYLVSVGDVITLKEKSKANSQITENIESVARRGVPSWIELDKDNIKATVKTLPHRDELTMPIQEHLIVELYSK